MDKEWKNKLWYGDNLEVLRNKKEFPDDFVDLIYLDPPFNSNANYNMLFKEKDGGGHKPKLKRLPTLGTGWSKPIITLEKYN